MTLTTDKKPSDGEPSELFHYTNAAGIYGIFKTSEFRATSVQYMNDGSELTLAIELCVEALRRHAKAQDEADDERASKQLRSLADSLPHLLQRDPDFIMQPVTTCAISFSAQGDRLSQWRAYGGYALGFQFAQLRSAISFPWSLKKCVYERDEQHAILDSLIEDYVKQFTLSGGPGSRSDFWFRFLYAATVLKHKGFDEEEEWRLVSGKVPLSTMEFRPGGSMLIPYRPCKLNLRGMSLRVRVGPHPHQDLASAAVQAFLRSGEIGAAVDNSPTPYRTL